MVALTSFFLTVLQSLAFAAQLDTTDNIQRAHLEKGTGGDFVVISRYLSSGEVEEEKIPLDKGPGERGIDTLKNFVGSAQATTK